MVTTQQTTKKIDIVMNITRKTLVAVKVEKEASEVRTFPMEMMVKMANRVLGEKVVQVVNRL
jgi:hypothetical protein